MATVAIPADSPARSHPEWQYLDLMRRIWEEGSERVDRTGIGTRSIFGAMLRFDLSDGRMPLITTKRVYWKTATREMLWFLTGETNIRPLVLQGVKIWNEWPHANYVRETGDKIALEEFVQRIADDAGFAERWGDLGPVYGKQWVDWPTYRYGPDGKYERGPGINQVAEVVESLRNNPGSRRHIIEGWNVAELDRMALPPCHKTYQFHVGDGKLNCALYQRSCDVALGLPFNLWSGALLQRMVAQQVGLEPGEFVWMGGDTHLYLNHEELVTEQLTREPQGEPKLEINRRPSSIFDYEIGDFIVHGYEPLGALAAPVAV
ncbi:MAG: thymidylate synthase [Sphingomonadaceae bacterium]|nr:thymidylate synthase [Altererythrobacter sp.]MCP5391504.1 thymidylate synthase [Sphingomonadaceae bacterium]MCP5394861.1 thymidylate synthase [Sphingomonadaceae bacterium]MCP5397645.1 thymidylate synthase [Sphingomonadaceae bacterium]